MAVRQPWDDDPVVSATPAPALRQIVPPSPGLPTARTADQARAEAAGATNAEYRTGADPRNDARAEQKQNFDQVTTYRTEFNSNLQVREFLNSRNAFLTIRRLGESGTPAGDIGLIFSFMRTLDPTSTVREGEFATAQNSAGVPERVRNWYNQTLNGERLSPRQRADFTSTAAGLVRSRAGPYNEAARRYRSLITGLGVDPSLHIPLARAGMNEQDWAEYRQRHPEAGPERQLPALSPVAQAGRVAQPQNSYLYGGPDQQIDRSAEPPTPIGADDGGRNVISSEGGAFLTNQDRQDAAEFVALARGGTPVPDLDAWLVAHNRTPISQTPAQLKYLTEMREAGRDQHIEFTPTPTGYSEPQGGMRGAMTDAASTGPGAAVVGSFDTLTASFADELSGLATGVGDWASGGSFDEGYNRAVDEYRTNREHVTSEHPYWNLAGQLAGGVFLPTRVKGAAESAATLALASGATRAEATAAARAAAARQLAIEGGAYGGAHGLGSGENDILDRLSHAAVGVVTGSAAGFGLGKAGVGSPRLPREERAPLVDPVTERLNQPLESASPAERVAAARAHDIDLPMGAAFDRPAAIVEKGLDIVPGSAGRMEAGRRGLESQVEAAAERQAAGYGDARTFLAGGEALQRGARGWVSRFDETSTRAYEAIPIGPQTPADLTNSRAALERLTSTFESNPALAEMMRNGRLVGMREALAGRLSWQDLKALRSRIGNEIGEARFSDSPTRDELRALYGALSEDMRATAVAQGPRALRAFERANTLYRQGQERIDSALVRILGDDSRNNPEAAARAVQTIARSGRGSSNLAQLAAIRASTIKGGEWDEVSSSIIRLMGQPANSAGREFSPQTFVQTYGDMSESARNLLFGGGNRELRQALDSFVAVNQRLAGSNALRNTSNTAPGITGAGAVVAGGNAIFNPILGLKFAGAMAAANGMARLWTSPRFVNWATGYSRMVAGAARAGEAPPAAVLARQRDYLARVARSSPAIAAELAEVEERLFGGERRQASRSEAPRVNEAELDDVAGMIGDN